MKHCTLWFFFFSNTVSLIFFSPSKSDLARCPLGDAHGAVSWNLKSASVAAEKHQGMFPMAPNTCRATSRGVPRLLRMLFLFNQRDIKEINALLDTDLPKKNVLNVTAGKKKKHQPPAKWGKLGRRLYNLTLGEDPIWAYLREPRGLLEWLA